MEPLLELLIKIINDGKPPTKAHPNDAGFDCYANADVVVQPGECKPVPLGFAVKIPDGYFGQLCGRSGLAFKYGLMAHVGTIDSNYTGEVMGLLFNTDVCPYVIHRYDRVAQLIVQPVPRCEVVLVSDLPDTERNENGFGSTGI